VDRARPLPERPPTSGVRLGGYFGDASDLPQAVLQDFLDAVRAGEATVLIAKTYTMDEIATAHDDMEHDRVTGKLVVSTRPRGTPRIRALLANRL
jgi:NADPH:quinone reductase